MLLDWIEAAIASAYRELAGRIAGTQPAIVDTIVEAAALVAVADGPARETDAASRTANASPAARREQAEAINAVRQIANLDRLGLNHAVRRFEAVKAELRRDGPARAALLARLGAAGLSGAEARLVLSVAGGVAAVDGHVSDAEVTALNDVAAALGLPPAVPPGGAGTARGTAGPADQAPP
ncbi:TerB family tellurite resistance protein [Arenibaculum pallidiluteum]|uniref:TerB family tellurite resistance protein n=1 Tax=Arenibaculum pallidiluteum TaxID=2812559 RepID=UPI001A97C761|nr:TerB family tellurite resistance protein [Arenibaculum pallidiluteum]